MHETKPLQDPRLRSYVEVFKCPLTGTKWMLMITMHWLELHKERLDRNNLQLQPSTILSRTFVLRFLDKLRETLVSENIPF